MHVLAIYSVNEHLADLMSDAAAERQAKAAKAPKAKGSRFAFVTSHFVGRLNAAVSGPTKAFDY
jgi:hypothetical protein